MEEKNEKKSNLRKNENLQGNSYERNNEWYCLKFNRPKWINIYSSNNKKVNTKA